MAIKITMISILSQVAIYTIVMTFCFFTISFGLALFFGFCYCSALAAIDIV